MGFPLSLSMQDYEALVALAREGTKGADGQVLSEKARKLNAFLLDLEKRNGIERDALWIQWQEAGTALPPTTDFPEVWPPELRKYIELVTRKINRADVEKVLEVHAQSPMNVLVTKDPGAQVGWTTLDAYFVT